MKKLPFTFRNIGIFLILLLGNIFTTIAQDNGIILGRPTDTSITASVMFRNVSEYYLEYGTQSGIYTANTATYTSVADVPDEIDLRNLTPDTRYYYRMRYRLVGAPSFSSTNEFNFTTQRPPGSRYCFTIETDEHLYDKKGILSMYNVTLANQAKDKPDFMFSLGDIFGDDHTATTISDYELDTLHRYYRPILGQICHSIPFFIGLGNHEGEKKYWFTRPAPARNMGVPATIARKKYYPNPFPNTFYTGNTTAEGNGMGLPENYYAFTWGDALYVVLDVYRDNTITTDAEKPQNWNWTLGLTQYLWLKNTLQNSHAKFKFVFCHHTRAELRGGALTAIQNEWGGYSSATGLVGGNYQFDVERPAAQGWTKPIHQLFRDYGVNIFFQGHDHTFAHEVLDSITYQSLPMPSDSTYNIWQANASAYLTDVYGGTGHVRVTVTPGYTKVDYVQAYLPADTLSGLNHNGQVPFYYYIRAKDSYTFIGNGNWSDANNWVEKTIPPANLPAGYTIYIEPVDGGECVLNVTQNILTGAKIEINSNKKFVVPGTLNIQQ